MQRSVCGGSEVGVAVQACVRRAPPPPPGTPSTHISASNASQGTLEAAKKVAARARGWVSDEGITCVARATCAPNE